MPAPTPLCHFTIIKSYGLRDLSRTETFYWIQFSLVQCIKQLFKYSADGGFLQRMHNITVGIVGFSVVTQMFVVVKFRNIRRNKHPKQGWSVILICTTRRRGELLQSSSTLFQEDPFVSWPIRASRWCTWQSG